MYEIKKNDYIVYRYKNQLELGQIADSDGSYYVFGIGYSDKLPDNLKVYHITRSKDGNPNVKAETTLGKCRDKLRN